MKKTLFIAGALATATIITACHTAANKEVKNTPDLNSEFFKNYASALLTYSPGEISSFYQVPLTVYSDEGIQQVNRMSAVKDFWKQGVKPYQAMGIKKSIPEIVSEDRLSQTITTCKVLWRNYDANDKEIGSETNFYILSQTEHGLKISGLIIMAK